jgi:hypothetical protein
VLCEEARHHYVAVILRARVLAIATIELIGHPLRESARMRLDGCQFLGMAGHVVREGVRQLGCQGLTALDALGGETKRSGLETGITRRHAKIIARQGTPGTPTTRVAKTLGRA